MDTNKQAKLQETMDLINKQYGKGAVMKLGDNVESLQIETFSSGSLSLDIALGGGFPKGRIIELYGAESSGKSTISMHAIKSVQQNGGVCGYIDAEHAFDPTYASNIGIDLNELYISQPDSGEQALSIAEQMIKSGAIDLVVIDSVAALVPKAELEGEMGDAHVGLQARMMSQALRKLTAVADSNKCAIIFINQLREKVGVMFGSPLTTAGGRALKFYASVRLDVARTETSKQDGVAVANKTRVKVVKNKIAPPFKEATFEIVFGEGISYEGDVLDTAAERGIVNKSGAWYSYKGEKIGQGREAAKAYLKENPEICQEIYDTVMDAIKTEKQNKD